MKELEALNIIHKEYQGQSVNIMGISLDDIETYGDKGVKGVVDLLGLEFTNVMADMDYMMEMIKFTNATPTIMVVDRNLEFLLAPMPGSGSTEKAAENFREIIAAVQEYLKENE